MWDAIGDLPPATKRGIEDNGADVLHWETRLSPLNIKRLQLIPPGGGFEDLPVEMRVKCHRNGADKIGHRYVYGRLAPERAASTITARFDSFTRGKSSPIHLKTVNISLREVKPACRASRIHSSLTGSQETIAALNRQCDVPPRAMAEVVGSAIHKHLTSISGDTVDVSDVSSAYQVQIELYGGHSD